MQGILITKPSIVNVLLNQFYKPALVNRTLLFLSKSINCFSLNYFYLLYALIVGRPDIADKKPLTTGEFVLFSNLVVSL